MPNRFDNFDRADSTTAMGTPSGGGSDWINEVGPWGISSNKGYSVNNAVEQVALLESSLSNVEVQVTISGTGDSPGLVGRCLGGLEMFILQCTIGGTLGLYILNGGYTNLGNGSTTIVTGDIVKLRMYGSALTAFLNGVQEISATNSTFITQTRHGLRAYISQASRFDDFSITEYPAASPSPASSASSAASLAAAQRLFRNSGLEGLGGTGQKCFNPPL